LAKKVRPGLGQDPQRDLVYAVEKLHLGYHTRHSLPRRSLYALVRRVCKAYGVRRPTVRIGKVDRGFAAICDFEEKRISLDPKFGCNGLTVLHELAHWICFLRYPSAQLHGAAFCRIYGELLDRSRLVPFEGWKAVCARHGVKVLRYLPKH
jgi:hypothetical protein